MRSNELAQALLAVVGSDATHGEDTSQSITIESAKRRALAKSITLLESSLAYDRVQADELISKV